MVEHAVRGYVVSANHYPWADMVDAMVQHANEELTAAKKEFIANEEIVRTILEPLRVRLLTIWGRTIPGLTLDQIGVEIRPDRNHQDRYSNRLWVTLKGWDVQYSWNEGGNFNSMTRCYPDNTLMPVHALSIDREYRDLNIDKVVRAVIEDFETEYGGEYPE